MNVSQAKFPKKSLIVEQFQGNYLKIYHLSSKQFFSAFKVVEVRSALKVYIFTSKVVKVFKMQRELRKKT